MSEQENFLTRWSRRKREAAEDKPVATPSDASDASDAPQLADEFAEAMRPRAADERPQSEKQGEKEARAAAELPAIDISKLPPIDAITATTDIRPFLAAGVPEELKYAALRRAWVVDPSIRDFVGIAENQWDFTAPDGAPGFGPLLPGDDVHRLIAQVIGEQDEVTPPEVMPSRQAAVSAEESAPSTTEDDVAALPRATSGGDATMLGADLDHSESEEEFIVHHENIDAALQKTGEGRDEHKQLGRRGHGSALPK